MPHSDERPDPSRGYIIPIGGAEEKVRDRKILRRFVELCGGDSARIAIIPTASQLEDTGSRYEDVFRDMGVPPPCPARHVLYPQRSKGRGHAATNLAAP